MLVVYVCSAHVVYAQQKAVKQYFITKVSMREIVTAHCLGREFLQHQRNNTLRQHSTILPLMEPKIEQAHINM